MEPTIWRRQDLLAAGYTDEELRKWLRQGMLTPLRRGNYVTKSPRTAEQTHALDVRGAPPELADDAIVSHVSAAVCHGLPIWNVPLDRAHH